MNRRQFLTGLTGLIAAPALVRASSLEMGLPPRLAPVYAWLDDSGNYYWSARPIIGGTRGDRIRAITDSNAWWAQLHNAHFRAATKNPVGYRQSAAIGRQMRYGDMITIRSHRPLGMA